MKKKLFSILALVLVAMSASASGYELKVGTTEHGSIAFTVGGETRNYAIDGETVTVTITPSEGWAVNQPSGQWIAAVAEARSNAPIDLLKDVELTAAGENQWTFTMVRANVEISATYKKLLTNTDITIDDIQALTYNGQAQEPTVTVQDGSTVLTLGTDYTVSYSNNTNAAEANAQNAPTVTITALATSENYAGETTKTFTINPATLTAATLQETNFTYNQQEQTAQVATVTAGTLTVPTEGYDVTENTATNVGNYNAKITGKGNYTGEVKAQFSIVAADAKLFELTLTPEEYFYDGTAKSPTVVVKDGNAVLTSGKDYTLAFSNNVNAGTAIVTATGKGNYTGTKTATFTIQKALSKVSFGIPYKFEKTLGDPNFTITAEVSGQGTLTYKSDDVTVATVDEKSGEVTLVGVGVTKIWATMSETDNYANAWDWYELTVVAQPEPDNTIPVLTEEEPVATIGDEAFYHLGLDEQTAAQLKPMVDMDDSSEFMQNLGLSANAQKRIIATETGLLFTEGENIRIVLKNMPAKYILTIDFTGKMRMLTGALTLNEANARRAEAGQPMELADDQGYSITETGDVVIELETLEGLVEIHKITLTKDDTATGINAVGQSQSTVKEYYDLNGRRINGKPAVKGVYVSGGKKVIVK